MTATVPMILSAVDEGAEETCGVAEFQTQLIGTVCGNLLVILCKTITPKAQLSTRLIAMSPCLIHLIIQSLRKSATRARSVAKWVAVESKESIHIMKKW
jgi:hypothetical protein